MNTSINIFANQIELNAPLREFIEEKIGSLSKHLGVALPEIRVEISRPSKHHRSGNVFYAEANMSLDGTLLRATAEDADLHTAITAVRDELQTQIKKLKDKKISARR